MICFSFCQNPRNKGSQEVQRYWSAPKLFFIAYACGIQRLGMPALFKRTQLSKAITKSIFRTKKEIKDDLKLK